VADDQKSGQDAEGTGKAATQKSETISMSAYKKLQGDLQKANDSLKELRAKAREGQSVEAQLAEVQSELEEANRKLRVADLKAGAPKELHDFIDKQLAKGRDLDAEDIQDLVDRLPKADSKEEPKDDKPKGKADEKADDKQKESSGVRNSGPKQPDVEADVDDFLKKTNMKDALGF
jgi:hypothetical protein